MIRNDFGLTMVEVAVIAAMIALLAVLAVQNYAVFKSNACDSTAASDTRNVAPAAELAASEGESHLITLDGRGGPVPELPGVVLSPDVEGTILVEPDGYTIELWHRGGTMEYVLDSERGWSVSARSS